MEPEAELSASLKMNYIVDRKPKPGQRVYVFLDHLSDLLESTGLMKCAARKPSNILFTRLKKLLNWYYLNFSAE